MKKIISRKLLGMLLGVAMLVGLIVLLNITKSLALTELVLITYGALIVFLIAAYIGGNVFNAFVKSKFFRSELNDQDSE